MHAGGEDRSRTRQAGGEDRRHQHPRDPQHRADAPRRIYRERHLLRTDHDAAGVGLPGRGADECVGDTGKWWGALGLSIAAFFLVSLLTACTKESPESKLEHLEQLLHRGNLVEAQLLAERAASYY